jgi:hypothetical protein
MTVCWGGEAYCIGVLCRGRGCDGCRLYDCYCGYGCDCWIIGVRGCGEGSLRWETGDMTSK